MQDEYCMYLISKIKECDNELLKIANESIPITHAYYESYLKMSRSNYIKLLSTNCNQNINPKYFKRFSTVGAGLQSHSSSTQKPAHNGSTELNASKSGKLRPVAKAFYPTSSNINIIHQQSTTDGPNYPGPIPSTVGIGFPGKAETDQLISPNNNQPPPLLEDDYQDDSKYEFTLFTNKKCCHGIYCAGYFGIYNCPYQEN